MPFRQSETLSIERLELSAGRYTANSYIVVCRQTAESVIIDAPGEARRLAAALEGTRPRWILLTHSHPDHVGGLAELKAMLKVPLVAHPDDAAGIPVPIDRPLSDGETVAFGGSGLRVLHTPGHTPGSLCFLGGRFLLAGDTLFPGGPGHSKTPAALKEILASIRRQVLPLPDETNILAGHGPPATLGAERLQIDAFLARQHDPALCGDVLWSMP